MRDLTRQEQRLVRALGELRRAVSSLDIAIDYDHPENLHPDVLVAIVKSRHLFTYVEDFLGEVER